MPTSTGVKNWTLAALVALLAAALIAQGRVSLFRELDTSAALAMLLFALVAVVAGVFGLWSARTKQGGYPAWFYGLGCAGHVLLLVGLSIAVLVPLVGLFSVWAVLVAPFCGLALLGAWRSWRKHLTESAQLIAESTSRRSPGRALLLALGLALIVIDVALREHDHTLGAGLIAAAGFGVGLAYWLMLGTLGVLGLYWGAPPRFAPIVVTRVLTSARVVMIPLLAWPIQAHFRGAPTLDGLLIALPYATNAVGSWSFFYELVMDRVQEPRRKSEDAALEARYDA